MAKSFTAGLCATCFALFIAGCAAPPEPTNTTVNEKPPVTPSVDDTKTTPTMTAVDFAKDVKPVVETYCLPCHAGPKPKGDMDVTKLTGTEKETFAKMAKMVESGKMPPANGKPIPDADKGKIVESLKALGS